MPEPHEQRLDSWKEIAEYLSRDVRTARRWEQERGLPVHRLPGRQRSAVFAFPEELKCWMESQADSKVSATVISEELPPTPLPPAPRPSTWRGALMATGLALLVWWAVVAIRTRGFAPLDHLGFDVDQISGFTRQGGLLWRHALKPGQMAVKDPAAQQFIGLMGNRRLTLAVTEDLAPPWPGAHLRALRPTDGRQLWDWHPSDTLRFGQDAYGPPWKFSAMAVATTAPARIAVAVHHRTWWPSTVTLLDANGQPQGEFINSGWITFLFFGSGRFAADLFAGGVSNARDGGALAILNRDAFQAHSPELPGTTFACLTCPGSGPEHYFVFPRSELNRITGQTFNTVIDVTVTAFGFEVQTSEGLATTAIYDFGLDFTLRRARFGERYWDWHRRLEAEGRIHHSVAECPDRFGPGPVAAWSPDRGWQELRPQAFEARAVGLGAAQIARTPVSHRLSHQAPGR